MNSSSFHYFLFVSPHKFIRALITLFASVLLVILVVPTFIKISITMDKAFYLGQTHLRLAVYGTNLASLVNSTIKESDPY